MHQFHIYINGKLLYYKSDFNSLTSDAKYLHEACSNALSSNLTPKNCISVLEEAHKV